MLIGVPSQLVPVVWGSVRPFLERSFEKTKEYRFGIDDIAGSLARQDAQLWVGGKPMNLVVVTEIINYPKAKVLDIGPIAGELGEDWQADLAMLEDWARSLGCSHVATLGRPGWRRKLGWGNELTYISKEL